MFETSYSAHLTNQDLLSNLLGIPNDDIEGDSITEIIDHLLKHSDKSDQAVLVKEIISRYGEHSFIQGKSFNNSEQIYKYFRFKLTEAKQESFFTILLDNKHRIIKEQIISLGILNKSLVHPRECFAPAIEHRAAAIVLVHNHPSGDPQPSTADINITKRLVQVGEIVGISVLDHIIIGNGSYYSFVDEDVMP
jgi:DNA repair protein RadC